LKWKSAEKLNSAPKESSSRSLKQRRAALGGKEMWKLKGGTKRYLLAGRDVGVHNNNEGGRGAKGAMNSRSDEAI
jgi:hypothetical protein